MLQIIIGFLVSFQIQAAERFNVDEVLIEQVGEARVSLVDVKENYKSGIIYFIHQAVIPVKINAAGSIEELLVVKNFRSMTGSTEPIQNKAALYVESIQKEIKSKDALGVLVDRYNIDGLDVVEISVESKGLFTKVLEAVSGSLSHTFNKYEGDFVY